MELNVKDEGTRVCFEIGGIIDAQGAEVLDKSFNELDPENVKELILDFGNVGYIGSAGVGKLLKFYKELTARDGKLRVENVSGMVQELLTITKMDTFFGVSSA